MTISATDILVPVCFKTPLLYLLTQKVAQKFGYVLGIKRYTEVKEWDNGYIVVMADYEGMGETEEYIDLLPILKNLYINPETFLKPIKTVKIDYHEGRRN